MNDTEYSEIAKTTRKGLEIAEKLGNFLDRVLGSGFKHLGNAFSDWAQTYRYKNLLVLIDKIEQIHKERHVSGKTVPMLPKHAIPILEYASLEDNEDIMSMWAALIANSTDPNKQLDIKKLYISTLANLDPIDVRILIFLRNDDIDERYGLFSGDSKLNADAISQALTADSNEVLISLSNLFREGLLIDSWENTWSNIERGYGGVRVNNPESNFRLSHLGRSLVDACSVTHNNSSNLTGAEDAPSS